MFPTLPSESTYWISGKFDSALTCSILSIATAATFTLDSTSIQLLASSILGYSLVKSFNERSRERAALTDLGKHIEVPLPVLVCSGTPFDTDDSVDHPIQFLDPMGGSNTSEYTEKRQASANDTPPQLAPRSNRIDVVAPK